MPDPSLFTYDMELLDYAAHMWRIADTPLPPSLAEVLTRDKEWDYQVSMMRQLQQYFVDAPKRQAETKGAIQGIGTRNTG
jgi:hypothetical protein